MERLMSAKIGLVSLGLLAAAGLGAMLLGSREDQYCLDHPFTTGLGSFSAYAC